MTGDLRKRYDNTVPSIAAMPGIKPREERSTKPQNSPDIPLRPVPLILVKPFSLISLKLQTYYNTT